MNSVETNIPVEDNSKVVEIKDNSSSEKHKSNEATSEATTVFTDPVNFTVKHPLHNAWALWYDCPAKRKTTSNWGQNIKKLVTIDSVEDFWGVFNNIAKPSELVNGATYHFFRDGIRPEWEDPANEKGGKWMVHFKKKTDDFDTHWLFTLLACIGETLDEEDELNGAIFSSRTAGHRLTLWTRSYNDLEKASKLGQRFKETLHPFSDPVEFSSLTEGNKSKTALLLL